MSKTMAEIIKDAIEFTPYWVNGGLNQDPYENAVKALTAAGFGLVADAKAEAWDEGQKSGMRHADRLVAAARIGRPELPGPISPNPYRALREPVKPTPEGR